MRSRYRNYGRNILTKPINVQIITTAGCEKCVAANRALAQTLDSVRGEYQVDVQELNLVDHPEVAAEHGFWTTPAMIINGKLAFAGSVEEAKLREKLAAAARGYSE
jgi:glutaredoxin